MRIDVRLSERDLIAFSLFDVFVQKRRWVRPAVFAAILGGSAAVCFALHQRQGAVLLGCVLAAVAVGLPAAYVLSFFLSVRRQARAQGLGSGKWVYALELGREELSVDNGKERAAWPWAQVARACRRPGATYLYLTPQRAFLIPHRCLEGGGEALWALLGERIAADRCRGRGTR